MTGHRRVGDTAESTMRRIRRMSHELSTTAATVRDVGLPPGPRWPALVQSAALFQFRHRFHTHLHRRYGDTFTVRMIPGGRPLVLVCRPEDIREVFAGDPAVFHAGKGNAIFGPVMGEHSVLLQDGAHHRRARKLLMPAFHGDALRGYRALVAEVAAAHVGGWRPGETFRSLDRMNALTLDVILRVVFGVVDGARLAELRARVAATVNVNPATLLGWTYPRLQRLWPWRAAVENQIALDRLIHAEISDRRQAPDLRTRGEMLSRLARGHGDGDGLDDTELRDQLVTLLLAGHETTASALAWTLHELGKDADLLARTQHAADRGGDDWLEAVLKEAMRLHPVISVIVRTLTAGARVGGFDLPAGTTVGPSIIASHESGENFPEPHVFRPERFLPDQPDGQPPPPNTWIPFGGGVRRCVGAAFALMEGVEVLRAIVHRFDIAAVGRDGPRVRNITSVPRRGARIRITARTT